MTSHKMLDAAKKWGVHIIERIQYLSLP